MAGLTPKQARFVEEYLIDLNATQAAIRVGYSAKTANREGARLLSNAVIANEIEAALKKRSQATGITSERVLKEIAAMAFYDPAELIGIAREIDDGEDLDRDAGIIVLNGRRYVVEGITSPAHIAGLSENVRRAIVGWSWDRNNNFTLKLADKSKALDQLARHLSLYNDKLEVQGLDGLAQHLAYAEGRDA